MRVERVLAGVPGVAYVQTLVCLWLISPGKSGHLTQDEWDPETEWAGPIKPPEAIPKPGPHGIRCKCNQRKVK